MYFLTNPQIDGMQHDSVAAAFSLAQRAFECFEELVELNQQMVKTTLAENQKAWLMAVSGQAPVELWSHQTHAARSLAEKARSYNHQLLGLATHTHAEWMKFTKARFEQHNGKLQALVDGVASRAPAGSDAAVTILKSTASSAGAAYDTVLKATAQAIAMAQRNQLTAVAPDSEQSRDHAGAD
jgi:phasin family protein